jgi:hypothetical protein
MTDALRLCLLRQFETAWGLTAYHLNGLTTDECLWRPARAGLQVHRAADGGWRADWPDRETYDLGPPSIAWTTWHICFWWSMALDHSFAAGALVREKVAWPGDAEAVRARLTDLQSQWRARIEPLSEAELRSPARTRWPFRDRPFADVVAWVNVELTKNAAEIGYGRFLYAVRTEQGARPTP